LLAQNRAAATESASEFGLKLSFDNSETRSGGDCSTMFM